MQDPFDPCPPAAGTAPRAARRAEPSPLPERWPPRHSRQWLLASALCGALLSRPADATPSPEAAEHFDRGVELYREGNLDAALVELERAHALSGDPRVLFNLGQLQAERGRYVEATRLLESYLSEAGEAVSTERRSEVQVELERLHGRTALLHVESNVEGAALWLDDRQVAVLPLTQPLRVDAGVHRIRLTRSGYRSESRDLHVAGGDRSELAMALVAQPPSAGTTLAVPGPAADSDAPADRTAFWIAGSATALFAAGGVALALSTRSANQELERRLTQIPADRDAITESRQRVKTRAGLADGLAGAAAVSGVLATYFLLREPAPARHAHHRQAPTVRLLLRANGVTLAGRF